MTVGQKLVKTALKALEDLAAKEFSRDAVLEACRKAAASGFMSCRIRPSANIDVSTTQHMKLLKAELQKERLELIWVPHGLPGELPFKILEVRWEEKTR